MGRHGRILRVAGSDFGQMKWAFQVELHGFRGEAGGGPKEAGRDLAKFIRVE